jgi:5-oxoprolinase (ATP-hydrolysing)
MALADVAVESMEPSVEIYSTEALSRITARVEALKEKANIDLRRQGVLTDIIVHEAYLNMRYEGSDTSLMILEPEDLDYGRAFIAQHHREFSFTLPGRRIVVDDIRVRCIGKGKDVGSVQTRSFLDELKTVASTPVASEVRMATANVYFEESGGYVAAPVFQLDGLQPGTTVAGPAIILDQTQTLVIHPANTATILTDHVFIDVGLGPRKNVDTLKVDPIQLSIFGHRCDSIPSIFFAPLGTVTLIYMAGSCLLQSKWGGPCKRRVYHFR